jgi:hypothetical protein
MRHGKYGKQPAGAAAGYRERPSLLLAGRGYPRPGGTERFTHRGTAAPSKPESGVPRRAASFLSFSRWRSSSAG